MCEKRKGPVFRARSFFFSCVMYQKYISSIGVSAKPTTNIKIIHCIQIPPIFSHKWRCYCRDSFHCFNSLKLFSEMLRTLQKEKTQFKTRSSLLRISILDIRFRPIHPSNHVVQHFFVIFVIRPSELAIFVECLYYPMTSLSS